MEKFLKKAIKAVLKASLMPIAIVVGIIVMVMIILGAAVYFIIEDDGTYKEGDWSNAPFVAKQYNDGLQITEDGYLASNKSLNELWANMLENNSRVPLYLNGPKEYLQMMYAQMVTQLPDLREDPSKIRTLEEWKELFDNLEEQEGEFETFYGNASSSSSGSGNFNTFKLSDEELRGLTAVALHEQGTTNGAAAEASLMANLYEERGSSFGGIVNYVLNSGWFSKAVTHYNDSGIVTEEALSAVRSVLIDGKRTLPKYVNEHDYMGDIGYVENDGVPFDKNDRSKYIPHKTVIHQSVASFGSSASSWIFYSFPAEGSDPFGYTSTQAREQYGDECYGNSSSEASSSTKMSGYKTNIQGGIVRFSRNLVTGKSEATEEEVNKMKYDYQNYEDDYEAQQKEKKIRKEREEKNKQKSKDDNSEENKNLEEDKEENKEEDKEEDVEPLLEFEEWMKQRGYTKNKEDKWERNGQKISMSYVDPEKFEKLLQAYRDKPTVENRDEAMKYFTLEKGNDRKSGLKNSASLEDFLFIGDSLTVGLSRATLNDENKKAMEKVEYKAEIGKSANYWIEHFGELPSEDKVKGVCVMLGVNNPADINSMKTLMQKLSSKYKDVNIYIEKVLPVGIAYSNAVAFNSSIDAYNNEIQEYCDVFDNVYFIDTSDGYVNEKGLLHSDMAEPDGLHIKMNKYDKLVENILGQVVGEKTSTSSSGEKSTEIDEETLRSEPDLNSEAYGSLNPFARPQCTWFAWGKFYEVYGFDSGARGNGCTNAKEIVEAHPDKFELSTEPAAGAVFSCGQGGSAGVSAGHVGFVVAYDGNNIVTQEGNIAMPQGHLDWYEFNMTIDEFRARYPNGLEFAVPIGASISNGSKRGGLQYNVKIATWSQETREYVTDDPNDPNGKSVKETTVYTIKAETINYYDMVKQYTMPFDYLWSLMVITEDRGFVFELLRTIYESDIEVLINDKLIGDYVTTENTYTIKETASASGHATISYKESTPNEVALDGDTNTKMNTTTGNKTVRSMDTKTSTTTETANYTNREVFNEKYTTANYVGTVTNTVEVELGRANVWIVDYTKNFVYKENPENEIEENPEVEEEVSTLDLKEEDIDYLGELALDKVSGFDKSILNLVVDGGNRIRTKSNKTTIKNITTSQGYVEGEKNLREKTGKAIDPSKIKNTELKFSELEGEVDIFEDLDEDKQKQISEDEIDTSTSIIDDSEREKKQEKSEEENKNETSKDEKTKDKEKDEDKGQAIENSTGTLITQFVTSDTFKYREKNFVTLLLTYHKAKSNILNVASWLFELLEKNESTVEMLDLTKYLLYKVTGDDKWGVTEFDFSIFDPDSFVDVGDGLYGDTIQEQVWFALRDAGYSEEATAGVLGNIESECHFVIDATESGGTGHGLCQWSFGLVDKLKEHARAMGKEWTDAEAQISFLIYSIDNIYGEAGMNGTSRTQWKNAKTPEEAAYQFEWWYEKHAGGTQQARATQAREYYEKFKGKTKPAKSGNGDVMKACKEVMNDMIKRKVRYSTSTLTWGDIKKSIKDPYACCATYVSAVLYKAGLLTEKQINSYNYHYTGSGGVPDMLEAAGWKKVPVSQAKEGDVVNMYGYHVMFYAGGNMIWDEQSAVVTSTGGPTGGPQSQWSIYKAQQGRNLVVYRAP